MSSPIIIAALYRFVQLDNFESLRQPLLQLMLDNQVRGTLLLAAEGINGTVAGSRQQAAGRGLENCWSTCARISAYANSIASFLMTMRCLFIAPASN